MRRTIFAISASCLLAACSTPELSGEADLRAAFPEHAHRVLASPHRFVTETDGAFATRGPLDLSVRLPQAGDEPIRVRANGSEIRVVEQGAFGAARVDEGAVVYDRKGGRSFWTATRAGAEEWLWLAEGLAHEGRSVATWQVDGAEVEQQGEEVVLRSAGAPVVRVAAPHAYARDGREVRARLHATDAGIELSVDADGQEVLIDPAWTPTGALSVGRTSHTATRLDDGRVLVVGGFTETGPTATTEIFDPTTKTWSAGPATSVAHAQHTATKRPNGKVVVAGGDTDGGGPTDVVEEYDPAANDWSTRASIPYGAVTRHTATFMTSGKILFTGGTDLVGGKSNVALFDPAQDAWETVGNMSGARYAHATIEFTPGFALMVGGIDFGMTTSSSDSFDETLGLGETSGMTVDRASFTLTKLQDGRVLAAGGESYSQGGATGTLEVRTATGWQSLAATLATPRYAHTATRMPDGTVLLVGGTGIGTGVPYRDTDTYYPSSDAVTPTVALVGARAGHAAALLANTEQLLVVGGTDMQGTLPTVEYFGLGLGLGAQCLFSDDCASKFCVENVCCDLECGTPPCASCTVATGAVADGTCALFEDLDCDDQNGCTTGDSCSGGVCAGTPVECEPGPCETGGTCDEVIGCLLTPKPDGAPCPNGVCFAGGCLEDPKPPGDPSGTGVGGNGAGGGPASGAAVTGTGGTSAIAGGGSTSEDEGGGGCSVPAQRTGERSRALSLVALLWLSRRLLRRARATHK